MAHDRPIHRGRVGLVTIIDYANYGNRLQNYAMQRIIAGLGFACTTILNSPHAMPPPRPPLRALLARTGVTRLGRRLLRRARGPAVTEKPGLRQERQAAGRAFTRAHIRESDFTLYRDTVAPGLDAMFDHFVVGSDQVWNPAFRELSELDFLTFAAKPKRIAFSASIGTADLPPEARDFYREHLAAFAHISVREEAAAALVRALTGREVPVTLDPTLMLGAEDWGGLATAHPARPAGDYLLTYFLGPRSDACRDLIDDCAARLGLAVVRLNDRTAPAFYAAGPDNFLGFVRDARLVLTDSFHGVIFSVIFGTPFLSFERRSGPAGMGSRLDTLLATLGLEHRRFRDGLGDADLDRLLEPDFAAVPPILERETKEALAYLAGALGQPAPASTVPGGREKEGAEAFTREARH